MELKKAKKCSGCWAYDDSGAYGTPNCVLGFNIKNIDDGKPDIGRMGGGQYWPFYCRPAEPCLKPTTSRQYVEAMKLKHQYL